MKTFEERSENFQRWSDRVMGVIAVVFAALIGLLALGSLVGIAATVLTLP